MAKKSDKRHTVVVGISFTPTTLKAADDLAWAHRSNRSAYIRSLVDEAQKSYQQRQGGGREQR